MRPARPPSSSSPSSRARPAPNDNLVARANASRPDATALDLFIVSLRRHAPRERVEILVFVDTENDEVVRARAREYGIKVVSYDLESSPTLQPFHVTMYRYALYQYLLTRLYAGERNDLPDAARLRYILLADVRDVVFQGDPFDAYERAARMAPTRARERLGVAMESVRYDAATIGACPHNRAWIQMCYPAFRTSVPVSLYSNPISCSGTTLGTAAAVAAYIDAVVRETARTTCSCHGHDQAIHNVLLWRNLTDVRSAGWWPLPEPEAGAPLLYVDVLWAESSFVGTLAKVPTKASRSLASVI
eukprot:tig00000157_g9636.t1